MRPRHSRTTASTVNVSLAMPCAMSVQDSSLRRSAALLATMVDGDAIVSIRLCPAGRGAGDLAEHRTCAQTRAARIVEVEQTTDQLARGIEPTDRLVVGVEHLAVGV